MIFLALIPIFVTIVLGPVFLFEGSANRGIKLIGVLVFVLAAYLQFFSRFDLAGMLIQVVLALGLALWRRFDAWHQAARRMASYRFCRSDDVPLLVQAYNECFHPPGGASSVNRDGFKWWIRALELWTSSCMVATEGKRLIGVLLAAKRENESCVLAVGVHPEFRHLEHGRHIVTSLSQKLAILGPPRILAEVPTENERFRKFLEYCGYSARRCYTDYTLEPPWAGSMLPAQLIAEIGLDELAGAGFPAAVTDLPWARQPRSVARRQEYFGSVRVFAFAGADRFEAALVVDEIDPSVRRLLAIHHTGDERSIALVGRLIQHYALTAGTPVVWERVHDNECPATRAAGWGLTPGPKTILLETTAIPA